jgi:hypothetical protein
MRPNRSAQGDDMRPEALVSVLVIALAGCAPKIEGFQIDEAVEGEPVAARAEISAGGSTLLTPELRFLDLSSGDGTLGNAIEMKRGSGDSWTGSIEGLTYGRYEIRLRAPYRSTWGVASKRESALLWVRPRPECFAFDDQQAGVAGWTAEGLFDGATASAAGNAPALAWSPLQWPLAPGSDADRPAGGSLRIDLPADRSEAPSGWWRADYLSPDLEGNEAWKGLTQVELRVAASFPARVQPAIEYRNAQGEVVTVVALDPEDDDVLFFELRPNRWEVVTAAPIIPSGAEVLRVRVRVFGQPGAGGQVWLDSVCPVSD